jgi:zinc transporter 5/7
MASSYALPTTAIPSHHHHSSEHLHEHLHSHSHSLSQSPPSLGASFPGSRPLKSAGDRPGHSHRHSHAHDHNHSHSHSHSRPHIPAPLSNGGHWRTGSTSGGKPLITPTHASFDANGTYQAPSESDAHDHHHKHDHDHHDHNKSVEKSKFTGFLLPYTAKWPLLHTVMTEKDSRRIFYFMAYVSSTLLESAVHMTKANAVLFAGSISPSWPYKPSTATQRIPSAY